MEKSKKILVVIDTNKLGNYEKGTLSCKNYKYLDINKHLHQSLVDNFSFKSLKNTIIEVAIPEIVLEELKQQQKDNFLEDLKKLEMDFVKFKELEGSELTLPELDYDSYLETKKESYLGVYNIKKINLPSKDIFSKLINKVLTKKKPFYKKNNRIDSGFKDALIWESIIEFVSKNNYDSYFFLTEDSDFDSDELMNEFFRISGKKITIVKEIADLKGLLEEEIKGTTLINESLGYLDKIIEDKLRDIIHSYYTEIITEGVLYEVKEVVGHQILDIDLSEGDFVLSVLFYLEHESMYAIHAKFGTFDESFIHHTEVSPSELKLIMDKNYKIKKIVSKDILINKESEMNLI